MLSSVCPSPSPCLSSCSALSPGLSVELSARSEADSSWHWPYCPSSPRARASPPPPWSRCCCCWRWCCTSPGSWPCPPGRFCPGTWHCCQNCQSSGRTSAWSAGHLLPHWAPSLPHISIFVINHFVSLRLEVTSQLGFRPPQSQVWQINLPVRDTTVQELESSDFDLYSIPANWGPRSTRERLTKPLEITSGPSPEQSVLRALVLILNWDFVITELLLLSQELAADAVIFLLTRLSSLAWNWYYHCGPPPITIILTNF